MDGPTIGIDVGAKASIHERIRSLAQGGLGVILISDEIEEVIQNCHRILVMAKGRIMRELVPGDVSAEELFTIVNSG